MKVTPERSDGKRHRMFTGEPSAICAARGSCSQSLRRGVWRRIGASTGRMGGVGELPKKARDDECHLLADVHGVVSDPLQRPRDEDHVHRPLARVRILADFDRQAKDLAVETVDLPILADEVFGETDVAGGEGRSGLDDLRAGVGPHLRQRLKDLLAPRWLLARERDELADVHARVAHSLDVLDHVQQRRYQPKVAGHWRLKGKQGEDSLVYFQVAPVDAVVVRDDHLRELDVLMVKRLEHAVELLHDQVKTAQGVAFQLAQLLLEVCTSLKAAPRAPLVRPGAADP